MTLIRQLRAYFAQPDKSQFIVSPAYDNFWFIFSPIWAIAVGWFMTRAVFQQDVHIFDESRTISYLFYMTLTQGHLALTFSRSHLNPHIFKQFPIRFTIVPIALVIAVLSHPWIWALAFVIMTFWDVYHSSLQTFGLGRIYDAKVGNDPKMGRRLDIVMNLFLYMGPVFAGAVLLDHMDTFDRFQNMKSVDLGPFHFSASVFASIPPYVQAKTEFLRWSIISSGLICTAVYVVMYQRFRSRGYKLSPQKIFMLASTAICSIFAWGFNSMGMAFLIMNVFHAVQYFALVWATEKRNLSDLFSLSTTGLGGVLLLSSFVFCPLFLGFLFITVTHQVAELALMVCAIMHFWYDSFIWSVQKKQHLQVTGN